MARAPPACRAAHPPCAFPRPLPHTHTQAFNYSISLGSGVVAGVVAAIISHPADTLLSKINKAGAGGSGSTISRLTNIAKDLGFVKLCTTGLGARCVMIGTLTAGQFGACAMWLGCGSGPGVTSSRRRLAGIFDIVLDAVGAKKFHFHVSAARGMADGAPRCDTKHPRLLQDPKSHH